MTNLTALGSSLIGVALAALSLCKDVKTQDSCCQILSNNDQTRNIGVTSHQVRLRYRTWRNISPAVGLPVRHCAVSYPQRARITKHSKSQGRAIQKFIQMKKVRFILCSRLSTIGSRFDGGNVAESRQKPRGSSDYAGSNQQAQTGTGTAVC